MSLIPNPQSCTKPTYYDRTCEQCGCTFSAQSWEDADICEECDIDPNEEAIKLWNER